MSQENAAARSPDDLGVSLPEARASLQTVAVSSHEAAPSADALCRKLRRDVFGIRKTISLLVLLLRWFSRRIGEQIGSSPPECLQLRSVTLDLSKGLDDVIDIALSSDQDLLAHEHARVTELIVMGAVIIFPVPIQALLGIHCPEPPGIQIILEEGLLVERGIPSADGDAFCFQRLKYRST